VTLVTPTFGYPLSGGHVLVVLLMPQKKSAWNFESSDMACTVIAAWEGGLNVSVSARITDR